MIVAYDGTEFHGWQRQKETRTVQGELEIAVGRVVCEHVAIVGASRTDSGVHARGQAANFFTTSGITTDHLLRGINSALPEDVAVVRIEEVDEAFTSRHAVGKHYQYRIWRDQTDNPFSRRYHWRCMYPLDIEKMDEAARQMVGEVEFRGLQVKTGKNYDTTIRSISRIELSIEQCELVIDVFGKAFMYKQVRSMVGLLTAVGRGRVAVGDVAGLLGGDPAHRHSEVAPPQGLTLMEVYY